MKIKILGTRGEIDASKPWHTKHTGILIDDIFMVDLGEEEYLQYEPAFIIFTHFHPDHACFVRRKKELHEKPEAYGPEKNKVWVSINVQTETFQRKGYNFIPIPVLHSLKVKSQAYIIEKGRKRLLVTGDLAWMEKKHQDNLGELDMVITEGSFVRKGGMIRRDKETGKIFGHTGVPDLIRIFREHTRHIVLIHFGNWFMKDVQAARKKIQKMTPTGIRVEAARDGQEYVI